MLPGEGEDYVSHVFRRVFQQAEDPVLHDGAGIHQTPFIAVFVRKKTSPSFLLPDGSLFRFLSVFIIISHRGLMIKTVRKERCVQRKNNDSVRMGNLFACLSSILLRKDVNRMTL